MTDEERRVLELGLVFLGVAIVFAAVGYAVGFNACAREVRWLRTELSMANDRLYLAWRDESAKIPSRVELTTNGSKIESALAPIPPELERFVGRYDAEEGKARARQEIYTLRSRGMKDDAIWMELNRRYGDF